jgi:hypothetical protein
VDSEPAAVLERGVLAVPEETWRLAVRRAGVIARLAAMGTVGLDGADAAAELGVSRWLVYVLLGRWRAREGVVSDLIPGKSSGGRRREQLPDEVEAVIRGVLRCRYLTRQKRSVAAACREIGRVCRSRPLSLPAIGSSRTSAYTWAFSMAGIKIELDLVLFSAGRYGGELIYIDLGPPPLTAVTAFAEAAVAKAREGITAQIPNSVSVASTPVRTADTADGKVGYRILGAGPPLVLIMGYSGTMEVWDRRFVDALAQHHRVVILDNAGIGQTVKI